jgi:hypothetical protein
MHRTDGIDRAEGKEVSHFWNTLIRPADTFGYSPDHFERFRNLNRAEDTPTFPLSSRHQTQTARESPPLPLPTPLASTLN